MTGRNPDAGCPPVAAAGVGALLHCAIPVHGLGMITRDPRWSYEALCAHPEWPVRGLVTLGAPLGIPNLIFDRLQPAPLSRAEAGSGPRGRWPGKGQARAGLGSISPTRPTWWPWLRTSARCSGRRWISGWWTTARTRTVSSPT